MINSLRFGKIHIVSREKVMAMREESARITRNTGDANSYAQLLANTLGDNAVLHSGYYLVQDMKDPQAVPGEPPPSDTHTLEKDGRRIILTDSTTNDLTRWHQFIERRREKIMDVFSKKKCRHESWDIQKWMDEFITHRSGKGIPLNFVALDPPSS